MDRKINWPLVWFCIVPTNLFFMLVATAHLLETGSWIAFPMFAIAFIAGSRPVYEGGSWLWHVKEKK